MAVTGHYNAVTSISGGAEEHIEGLSSGDEVLALCVHAAQKKKNSAQDCYFPLNRSTLACVEVELGDDDTPYIVSLLRKRQRMIQDIVASSDFQALNIHKKRKTLDLIAEDLSLVGRFFPRGDDKLSVPQIFGAYKTTGNLFGCGL